MAVKMLQEGAVSSKWLGFNWLAYEKLILRPQAIRRNHQNRRRVV
jgi:hypothetical protein